MLGFMHVGGRVAQRIQSLPGVAVPHDDGQAGGSLVCVTSEDAYELEGSLAE